jgi:hypothetical protein
VTAADIIDRARRARRSVGAVLLLFAPVLLAMVLVKRRGR